jgi:NAD(P)H-hydrate epimerase
MQREQYLTLWQKKYSHESTLQIIAGAGNNGGDGYWIANYALQAGYTVSVFAAKKTDRLTGDAKKAYQAYKDAGGKISDEINPDCDVFIDALLGIGFKGPLSEQYQQIIEQINALCKPVIAVDLPSGLDATSGEVSLACINAHYTLTFIALKQGLLTGNATHYVGQLFFAGLGLSDAFNQSVTPSSKRVDVTTLRNALPARHNNTYKHKLGHVLLIGGDKSMPGAIRIAAEACLRAGAGLVSVATHPDNRAIIMQGRPELMVHGIENGHDLAQVIAQANVCVVGPGLGQSSWSQGVWQLASSIKQPLVLDADGLTYFAKQPFSHANLIMTPHTGEASRLLKIKAAQIERNRFLSVFKLSNNYQACVILKGAGSLICDQSESVINTTGSPSMASAGMGDCLSGIIAALLAQGMPRFAAAQYASYIHGKAAQLAEQAGRRGLLVSDLFPFIRQLID